MVEDGRVPESQDIKEHVVVAIFLLHVGVTHNAVQSIAGGESGVVGAHALLHVEAVFLCEQERML